jgi:ABC-type sugar transport system substrate-binding protein
VQFIGGASLYAGYLSCLDSGYQVAPGAQNVMLALGPNTSPSTTGLQAAWKTLSAAHPSWKLVSSVYTDFTTPTSFADVENALQSSQGKSVTLIMSEYVEITAGVAKAVQAQHLGSKVKLMDVGGGSAQNVQLMQAGEQTSTCPTYPYSLGAAAIKTIEDTSKGIQPPKYVGDDAQPTPLAMITKADLSTFKPQW